MSSPDITADRCPSFGADGPEEDVSVEVEQAHETTQETLSALASEPEPSAAPEKEANGKLSEQFEQHVERVCNAMGIEPCNATIAEMTYALECLSHMQCSDMPIAELSGPSSVPDIAAASHDTLYLA